MRGERLALVGWAADSGVGRELADAARHLPARCAFILENPFKPTRFDLLTKVPVHWSRAANLADQMKTFLDKNKPDTILTWEDPGSWEFPPIWKERGIRWFHVVHWDWMSAAPEHLKMLKLAQLIAPNKMCMDGLKERYGLSSTLLPVPVDTDRLVFKERTRADTFISVYGYGPSDRRSIPELLEAWGSMKDAPRLVILAQKREEWMARLPAGVEVRVGNLPESSSLYENGDVAIQLSRYEGVGLSLLEAQARGLPVIAIDAPPMNEVVEKASVTYSAARIEIMKREILSYVPKVPSIVDAVLRFRGTDVRGLSSNVRDWVDTLFSWRVLGKKWLDVLGVGP